MKTADFLRQHNACQSGAKWALSISDDMADVWDMMVKEGKHEWLIWTATRPGVFSDTVARKLACRFVRETPLHDGRTVWDLLADERSRMAIEVAERYAEGKATKKELADATRSAYAAADVTDAAHAAYAEIAADAAALAAYDAANAAARAATWAACAAYVTNNAFNATYAAARAASAAAARAADGASASATARAADADAYDAQVQMIAELGNPFKEGETQ